MQAIYVMYYHCCTKICSTAKPLLSTYINEYCVIWVESCCPLLQKLFASLNRWVIALQFISFFADKRKHPRWVVWIEWLFACFADPVRRGGTWIFGQYGVNDRSFRFNSWLSLLLRHGCFIRTRTANKCRTIRSEFCWISTSRASACEEF